MDDDFNTPEAYSALFDLAREINRLKDTEKPAANGLAARLRTLAGVLGLLEQDPEQFLQSGANINDEEVAQIEALIQMRIDARAGKELGAGRCGTRQAQTRWASCWKMAQAAPAGAVSKSADGSQARC